MPRIVPFGGGGSSATPGGASGAYQYNNAGAFGGSELTRISATVTAAGPDSATPAAYTFRGQGSRAGTDVDVSGASLTVASGPGTGAAAVSTLVFQTPTAGASGSAAQTLTTRLTLSSASATATVPVVAAIGTVTTDQQCFSGTATWDAAGVAFTAAKINITDTASAAASKLLDLQVGGATRFSVDKAGQVTMFGGSATAGNTLQILFKEEQIAVANGVSTQDGTANWIPASAFIVAMNFRVDVQPGGTTSYSAGTSSSTAAFAPTGTSTTASTTFTGGGGTSIASTFGVVWSGTARTVRFTLNSATSDALGRITVRMWYFLPTVA